MPIFIYTNYLQLAIVIIFIFFLLFRLNILSEFFREFISPSFGQLLTGILFLLLSAIIIPISSNSIITLNKIYDLYLEGVANTKIGELYLDSVEECLYLKNKKQNYDSKLLPSNLGPNSGIRLEISKMQARNMAITDEITTLANNLSDQVFAVHNLVLSTIDLDRLNKVTFLYIPLDSKKIYYKDYNHDKHLATIEDILNDIALIKKTYEVKKDEESFININMRSLQVAVLLQTLLLIFTIVSMYLFTIISFIFFGLNSENKKKWFIQFRTFQRL